jgi:hypothetical protein
MDNEAQRTDPNDALSCAKPTHSVMQLGPCYTRNSYSYLDLKRNHDPDVLGTCDVVVE